MSASPIAADAAKAIKLVIFDVDGVLTDGGLFIGDDGQEYKQFNSKDGHGMVMLQHTGVAIGIITGRRTARTVDARIRPGRAPRVGVLAERHAARLPG